MPASDGEDSFESFRQRDGPTAALKVGADADDALDARSARPFDQLGQVLRKFRIIEVRVRVEKRRHGRASVGRTGPGHKAT